MENKRALNRFLLLASTILLFVATCCSEDTPQGEIDPDDKDSVITTSLVVSVEELNFEQNTSSQEITVTSNVDWTAYSLTCDWLSFSPRSGSSGSTVIIVEATENPEELSRSCSITIGSSDKSVEIPINQKPKIDPVVFSNKDFETFCLDNFDTNGDGIVSIGEAISVTSMDISGLALKSLDDISNFPNLETLNCSNNELTSIDLSDLTQLHALNCSSNKLVELDLTNNLGITSLDCTNNPSLTSIYVWIGFSETSEFKKPSSAQYILPNMDIPAGYSLVWNDEFNNTDNGKPTLPNSEKWKYETGGGGWGNSELQYYVAGYSGKDTCAVVSEGTLKIIAKKSGGQVKSIRMNTIENWTYGYFEARMKLPIGKGTWPAFWMLPKNFSSWPGDGEIDIMEHVGYRPNYVSSTIHCSAYNHTLGTQKGTEKYVSTSQSEFHVYALEWTEDYIKGYVDGNNYFTFKNDNKGNKNTWPFYVPFYLKLNLAWGGSWGGAQGVDESCLPATFEIDYVRVFQK